jgi:hypothetical protein
MVFSVQQIKYELLGYIKEFDQRFENWFVGIAEDPKKTLAEIHGLDLDTDRWIYKQALSFNAARTVQRYFLERLKADGVAITEGDENLDCVYAYQKNRHTRPGVSGSGNG